MEKVNSFRDLRVYQKLKELHLTVHRESLGFPKFEMSRSGSQVAQILEFRASADCRGIGKPPHQHVS